MKKKDRLFTYMLLTTFHFLLGAILSYLIPFLYNLTLRTAVLFYIYGILNTLIITILGYSTLIIHKLEKIIMEVSEWKKMDGKQPR